MKAGKPMLIRQSPLTGEWYAFRAYHVKKLIAGKEMIEVTGHKWDVTEQIETIIANAGKFKREKKARDRAREREKRNRAQQ